MCRLGGRIQRERDRRLAAAISAEEVDQILDEYRQAIDRLYQRVLDRGETELMLRRRVRPDELRRRRPGQDPEA